MTGAGIGSLDGYRDSEFGRSRLWGLAGLALVAALSAAGAVMYFAAAEADTVSAARAEENHGERLAALPMMKGPSGLPLPRFVSLKSDRVRVRRGPSTQHQVAWVYRARGLPVEIIAEFEDWRRIRDAEGEEGWIRRSLLSGWRTAMIAPWRKEERLPLRARPEKDAPTVAILSSGVIGHVVSCTGSWCKLKVSGYEGWIEQAMLWGVYAGEVYPGRKIN